MSREPFVHPYIPNSVPRTKAAMLAAIGVDSVEEILREIPEHLRLRGPLDLPGPLLSEHELRRHVGGLLERNRSTADCLSFLGGGCWPHAVPAVCDEVVGRAEFLTAYSGSSYSDLGKHQARFEYNSLMGELLDYEVVVEPSYDWGTAAGFALRMATRLTGRREVLVPAGMGRERLSIVRELLEPPHLPGHVTLVPVARDSGTFALDLDDLQLKLSERTAAVYFESPAYLGALEPQAPLICRLAHDAGALAVAGVDPISLGVVASPGSYGADIAVGDLQPLGIHMAAGTGLSGFMAFRDEEAYVRECPYAIYTILDTVVPGEHSFAEILHDRTSYGVRERAPDWVATQTGLWAICAGVYLAAMGPQGMREVGETILRKSHYAAARLAEVQGVRVLGGEAFFKEFVVDVSAGGRTAAGVNRALLERDIFGGVDLSRDYPELGECLLVCVTEAHSREDIDRLAAALTEVMA